MNLYNRITRVLINLVVILCLAITGLASNVLSVNAQIYPTTNQKLTQFEPEDLGKVKEYSLKNERRLEPEVAKVASSTANFEINTNSYKVQPILFLASDIQASEKNESSINNTFQTISRWYSGALEQNSSTYVMDVEKVIIYKSTQPLSYFKCINHEATCENSDGFWPNVQNELINAGFPLWNPGYSHIIFVKGAGGWAGSSCTPDCYKNWPAPGPVSTSGIAILGDWSLDAISGIVNRDCYSVIETACYDQPQRGAIAHELGHTFGLAHAMDESSSLMSSWWLFPYISLTNTSGNDEKSILWNSSFFTITPCSYNSSLIEAVQPTNVKANTQFISYFNIENTGLCSWKANNTKLNIVSENVWGLTSASIDNDVYPTQSISFTLNLKSPTLPKFKKIVNRGSFWQLKMGKKFFGQVFGNVISVVK